MKQKNNIIMNVVNVICIKWGTKYNAEDVNILSSMVKRNLTLPYKFVCLTDDAQDLDKDIIVFDIPPIDVPMDKAVSPWRKLAMFSRKIGNLSGKTLFLDLDIVIINNIDEFFAFSSKFTIIENWTQRGQGVGNSSVYCFEIGKHTDVLDYYSNNTLEVTENYSNEQIYLSSKIKDIDYWPDSWCQSFKKHCIARGICRYFISPSKPEDAKIIVFHGDPKPQNAIEGGFFGSIWKYTRPAEWIKKYWH